MVTSSRVRIPTARNPELEARLRASPDDDALAQVYGDWLQSEGDPRGDLIALQRARALQDSDELRALETALLEEKSRALLGPVSRSPRGAALVHWRLGFWDALEFDAAACSARGVDPAATLTRILEHPAALRLRELTCDGFDPEAFLALRPTPPLNALRLFTPPKAMDPSALVALANRFPALRSIGVEIGPAFPVDLLGLHFHRMRELSLVATDWTVKDVAALAALPLDDLEILILDLRGAAPRALNFKRLLGRERLPKLTRLGLFGVSDTDQLTALLARSTLLPGLTHLGIDVDVDVPDLALEAKGAFAHVSLFAQREQHAAALYNLGLCLRDGLGRAADALAVQDRALEQAPKDPDIWFERGNALDDLGRRPEARASWLKVVELRPRYAAGWYNLGVDAKHDKDWALAVGCFQKACKLDPAEPQSWHCLGHAHQELGQTEAAEKALRAALKRYRNALAASPDEPEQLFWIAAAHARLGEREAALEYLAKAIEHDPTRRDEARGEEDFVPMRTDEGFVALVGP